MIRSVALLSLALVSSVFAVDTIDVRLDGQLWTRPTGAANRLKLAPIGGRTPIAGSLSTETDLTLFKFQVKGSLEDGSGEIVAHGTAILAPAKAPRPAYVTVQTQLVHSNGQLIAECSSYHTLAEASPGVGACSGTIGTTQYGVTYFSVEGR